MIPMALVLPRAMFRWFVLAWSGGNGVLLRVVAGIRVEIRGRENIPTTPAIIASKHQSEWESNVFLHLLNDPVYVIKKELGYIPAYGQYARKMKMIFIDRGGHARTLRQLVKQAREAFKRNRPLVIFPEGTRIMPGQKLPYRAGVAGIYTELGVPVVPVIHNSGMYWPPRSFRKYPGTIILEFLPPIEPGLSRQEFVRRLETTMETAMERLLVECGGKPLPAGGAPATPARENEAATG